MPLISLSFHSSLLLFLNQERRLDFCQVLFLHYRDELTVFLMLCYYDELNCWPKTAQAPYITACKSRVQ